MSCPGSNPNWSFWGPFSRARVCCETMYLQRTYGELEVACLRIKGHAGKHEAVARDAGIADGVRFCCRVPLLAPHHPDCYK